MHNADAASAGGEAGGAAAERFEFRSTSSAGTSRPGSQQATAIVELDLTSLSVHQGYIETQVALGVPDRSGKLTIHTSTQGAFHGRDKVANTLGFPSKM